MLSRLMQPLAWLLLLALLLHGCSGVTTAPERSGIALDQHLQRQPHANPQVEEQLKRLDAALILAQEGKHQDSLQVIYTLQPVLLPDEYRWILVELIAHNTLTLQLGQQALNLMDQVVQQLPQLTIEQQYKLTSYRADALLLLGHNTAALRQRYNQSMLAQTPENFQHSNQLLWENLDLLTSEQLTELLATERQPALRGWIELAQIKNQASFDLQAVNGLLQQWRLRWDQHPAASQLPEELLQLAELSQQRITHIGVFLPETGPLSGAAEAIRNALVARHLATLQETGSAARLSFYDTDSASLDQLYQQAVDEGVEVVLGPLAKSQVDLLAQRRSLPLPTLALNYSNHEEPARNQALFQFGISAENEAQQVAARAWQIGFRRALTLTPESDWGTRVEASFMDAWQQLGGEITHHRQYGQGLTLDNALRQLLEVNQSQQRQQRLTRLLGQTPHFVARPREDSDFLFLHADMGTARQVRPGLNFLMAGHLPVLATSAVYSGSSNPSLDRDLNGLIFVDIPWYLNPDSSVLQQQIQAAWPGSMARYGRIYAMGVDAYLLGQRLHLLRLLPDTRLEGATGRLSQQDQRIYRELSWAQFANGRPQTLNEQSLIQQQHTEQFLPE